MARKFPIGGAKIFLITFFSAGPERNHTSQGCFPFLHVTKQGGSRLYCCHTPATLWLQVTQHWLCTLWRSCRLTRFMDKGLDWVLRPFVSSVGHWILHLGHEAHCMHSEHSMAMMVAVVALYWQSELWYLFRTEYRGRFCIRRTCCLKPRAYLSHLARTLKGWEFGPKMGHFIIDELSWALAG